MSVFALLTNGMQPLGSLSMGFMAAWIGIRLTIAAQSAVCVLALGLALLYRSRLKPESHAMSATVDLSVGRI